MKVLSIIKIRRTHSTIALSKMSPLSRFHCCETFTDRTKAPQKDSYFPLYCRIPLSSLKSKMRSRNASMSTLANYKEKASKYQRAINLINVIMIIEGIFLINQGLDLFNFYHLGHVSHFSYLVISNLNLFPTAQLLVPLLRLVPNLRLRPWNLPLCGRHLQHWGRQPAKQQRP